jgi:hypothetical protein
VKVLGYALGEDLREGERVMGSTSFDELAASPSPAEERLGYDNAPQVPGARAGCPFESIRST